MSQQDCNLEKLYNFLIEFPEIYKDKKNKPIKFVEICTNKLFLCFEKKCLNLKLYQLIYCINFDLLDIFSKKKDIINYDKLFNKRIYDYKNKLFLKKNKEIFFKKYDKDNNILNKKLTKKKKSSINYEDVEAINAFLRGEINKFVSYLEQNHLNTIDDYYKTYEIIHQLCFAPKVSENVVLYCFLPYLLKIYGAKRGLEIFDLINQRKNFAILKILIFIKESLEHKCHKLECNNSDFNFNISKEQSLTNEKKIIIEIPDEINIYD